jgi:DNA-nicking Smr family endonuclease
MRQKPPSDQNFDEDKRLWQRVTQHLTPLPNRQQKPVQRTIVRQLVEPLAVKKKKPQKVIRSDFGSTRVESPKPVDLREGDRAGLDARTQRRLFRGDVSIDRRLDLHGHTAVQAQTILQAFIEDATYSGCRCVLVITGKGTGVLKSNVPDWLKRAPLSGLVLALAEARQADGGSGAFYVLLRRRR